jgi:hypothetical protein
MFIHAFLREEYYYPSHSTPFLLVSNFGPAVDAKVRKPEDLLDLPTESRKERARRSK